MQPDQFTADHTTRTFVFSTTALDDSNSNQLTPIIDENFENGKTIYSILKSDQPNETLACYQIINEKQTFEGNLQANHDDENWIFQKIR